MVNMMMMVMVMNESQLIVNYQRWAGDRLAMFVQLYPEGVFVFHDADCRLAL